MKKNLLTYCLIIASLFAVSANGNSISSVTPPPSVQSDVVEFVDVYPNPAIDDLFLKFKNPVANDVGVEIRTFIGNQMSANFIIESSNLIKINISELPAGHYYVIISKDDEKTLKKFIKRA